ncbi:MAG: ComEC/Rec2 family competence protein [bacterium]
MRDSAVVRRLFALSRSHLPTVAAVAAATVLYLLPYNLAWHSALLVFLFGLHATALALSQAPAAVAGPAARRRAPPGAICARRFAWVVSIGAVLGLAGSQGVALAEARRGLPPIPSRVIALSGTLLDDVAPPDRDFPVRVRSVETERGVYRFPAVVVLEAPPAEHMVRGSDVHALVSVDPVTATEGPDGAATGDLAGVAPADRGGMLDGQASGRDGYSTASPGGDVGTRTLYVDAHAVAATAPPGAAIRGRLRSRVTSLAEEGDLELMAALLIGSRHGLSAGTEEAFRRAGSLHLLALSGMHVALLVALVYVLTRQVVSRNLSITAALAFTLFFLWIAGPRPSLIRAVFLTVGAGTMALFRRKTPLINLLALAFIFMATALPESTQQLSFHLSFLALLGILLAAPAINWLLDGRLPAAARKPLAAGVGAQLATAPVVATAFGVVYPIGAVAGIVLAPVVTLFLWGAVGAVVVDLLGFPALTKVFLAVLGVLEHAIGVVVAVAGRAPYVRLGAPASWIGAGAIFAALWLIVLDAGRRRAVGRRTVTTAIHTLRGV